MRMIYAVTIGDATEREIDTFSCEDSEAEATMQRRMQSGQYPSDAHYHVVGVAAEIAPYVARRHVTGEIIAHGYTEAECSRNAASHWPPGDLVAPYYITTR